MPTVANAPNALPLPSGTSSDHGVTEVGAHEDRAHSDEPRHARPEGDLSFANARIDAKSPMQQLPDDRTLTYPSPRYGTNRRRPQAELVARFGP